MVELTNISWVSTHADKKGINEFTKTLMGKDAKLTRRDPETHRVESTVSPEESLNAAKNLANLFSRF